VAYIGDQLSERELYEEIEKTKRKNMVSFDKIRQLKLQSNQAD